jgi:hypothetical protein
MYKSGEPHAPAALLPRKSPGAGLGVSRIDKSFAYTGLQTPDCPACILVATPTELSCLSWWELILI